MKYLILGMEFTEHELNRRCSEIMAYEYAHNVKNVTYENGCFWVEHIGFSAFPINSYTGRSPDAWEIIEKCWDGLHLKYITDWDKAKNIPLGAMYQDVLKTRWELIIEKYNCHKALAACIYLVENSAHIGTVDYNE